MASRERADRGGTVTTRGAVLGGGRRPAACRTKVRLSADGRSDQHSYCRADREDAWTAATSQKSIRASMSLDFLSDGGEMGRRLRTHDWGATALGHPETWPANLRAAVKLLLAARSPVAVGWGPELLTLHNDAYAEIMHGARDALELGLPLREHSPELWRRVGSLVDDAVRNRESLLVENQLFCTYRHRYAEETYFTLSCNPIADPGGSPGGVMIMLAETTEQVVAARRAAALRELADAGAAPRSAEDACRCALEVLGRHSSEIPFALLYVVGADRPEARLAAAAGLVAGTRASPPLVALESTGASTGWPVADALRTGATLVLDDLPRRFDPLPAGDWPLAPRHAIVVPLSTAGGGQEADAVVILGASARHELDAAYLDFVDSAAGLVAAALAAGRRREERERRAAAEAAAKLRRARHRARLAALEARLAGMLEERTRLARELHDTLLQGVTGVALQLRAALPHLGTAPGRAIELLEDVAELAEKTSREARQAVWDIRPSALGKREFVRAVEATARRALAGAPIALRFDATGRLRRLPVEVQGAVLRVVQEALVNVVRHAEACMVRVTLAYGARYLRVSIADDGRGFRVEPDFRTYTGHWGLLGMRERAQQIGGSLHVRSEPDRGTAVTLDVAVRPAVPKRPLVVSGDAA
jgi:signal transduction histidine kinase